MLRRFTLITMSTLLGAGCVSDQTYNAEVATATQYQAQAMDYQALNQKLTSELGAANAQIETLQDQLKSRSRIPCCSRKAAGS